MLEQVRYRYRSVQRRLRRLERREARELRRWLEDTENLLRLSTLVLVPVLMGGVTWLSNVSPAVAFLVYPPLASGTYLLFADPGGRYSTPRRFVGGTTVGALAGWVALEATAAVWYEVPPDQFQVHAGAAALGVFLTGVATWALDVEAPTGFSAALLVLVTGAEQLAYAGGIAVSSLLVAGVVTVWRRQFYRERARYLFQSTRGDDQVLVPIREETGESAALFAARLAAAHDSGKVVLAKTVPPESIEEVESVLDGETDRSEHAALGDGGSRSRDPEAAASEAEHVVTREALDDLERLRDRIERAVDVPCEFVVVVEDGTPAETVLATADEENCDLLVCQYEGDDGNPSPFVRRILSGETDAVVFKPSNGRVEWHRVLVMVRSPGEVANATLDFARRVVSETGSMSACTCISGRRERRGAEATLEAVVGSFADRIETRIAQRPPEEFLTDNASHYDLAVVGASTDRSVVSQSLSMPTFERLDDVECDLAIVHRG